MRLLNLFRNKQTFLVDFSLPYNRVVFRESLNWNKTLCGNLQEMFGARLYLDGVRKFKDLLLEASSVQVHIQRPVHALLDVRMIKTSPNYGQDNIFSKTVWFFVILWNILNSHPSNFLLMYGKSDLHNEETRKISTFSFKILI